MFVFRRSGFHRLIRFVVSHVLIQRNKIMNIVITGGSKGMGKALAAKFAVDGNRIFICARNENDLAKTASEINEAAKESQVQYFAADLSIKSSAEKFAKWLLDQEIIPGILINNAGDFKPGSIYNEMEGTLETMIAVNLYSAYYVTRAFLPSMMEKKSDRKSV